MINEKNLALEQIEKAKLSDTELDNASGGAFINSVDPTSLMNKNDASEIIEIETKHSRMMDM